MSSKTWLSLMALYKPPFPSGDCIKFFSLDNKNLSPSLFKAGKVP